MLVHFDRVAGFIVNANRSGVRLHRASFTRWIMFLAWTVEVSGLKLFWQQLRALTGAERRLLKWGRAEDVTTLPG
ncbi:MAG: hypothetical protein DME56_04945 [Verrucomicrobia bacterium]|nr:MAG: hypothetical protein DME56_04945 [Verrucomicrobiota bacterium]